MILATIFSRRTSVACSILSAVPFDVAVEFLHKSATSVVEAFDGVAFTFGTYWWHRFTACLTSCISPLVRPCRHTEANVFNSFFNSVTLVASICLFMFSTSSSCPLFPIHDVERYPSPGISIDCCLFSLSWAWGRGDSKSIPDESSEEDLSDAGLLSHTGW